MQYYDFKGNVTVRPPLDGGADFNYTWDVYDRLTGVTRSGQDDVSYEYDALGRLLRRTENPSGVDTTTVNYWVGLNRVAEEEWAPDNATYAGRALAVFRPDEETAATPAAGGWMRWSNENGAMTYEADAERGKVLKLTDENGESIPYSSNYLIGDRPTVNFNDADAPFADGQRRHLSMWLKPEQSADPWAVTVLVRTANRGEAQITFAAANGTNTVSGDCFFVYLGSSYMQGGPWRYWEWDLAATVAALDAGDSLTYVDGIVFRVGSTSTSGLYVDDIVLSDGRLKRSYAMLPGAALGGVLGSWTGPNVVAEAGNRVRYFQYNDLGTVLAQTKSDGTLEGAWEPDHFGNYEGRYAYSGSPARPELGLTGKILDDAAELSYFNSRWYDPERGIWMSEDPIGSKSASLYSFNLGAPSNLVDPNGLVPMPPHSGPWGGESAYPPPPPFSRPSDPHSGFAWDMCYAFGPDIGQPIAVGANWICEISQGIWQCATTGDFFQQPGLPGGFDHNDIDRARLCCERWRDETGGNNSRGPAPAPGGPSDDEWEEFYPPTPGYGWFSL